MSKFAEQITAFEQKRAALVAANEEIMEKAAEEGATLDAAEQEAFDNNQADIKAIDEHLKRLREMEKAAASKAKPVEGESEKQGAASRVPAQVKAPKPEPGIQFARYARCMILGKKMGVSPIDFAKEQYGERDPHVVDMVQSSMRGMMAQKGNVVPINTTTDSALIGNEGGFADYVTYLRNQVIVGRFGQSGIPALRRVPFYFPVVTQATGATANWVGEGKGKPLSRPTWTRTELTPLTVAALTATTIQALRFSSPSAEMALRDDLTAAVVEAIDSAFIDPANNGSLGAKPAAITYGIGGTNASTGSDADAIRFDTRSAMRVFVNAKNPLTSGVWIMSGSNALALATMVNALGQPEFPGMSVNGGTFMGLPVIVSEACGTTVTLVNAGDIWLADDGGVNVDTSTEASLQMVDADSITQDAIGTAGDPVETSVVSMFQTNSVAIRVETFINWARRRSTGVATITGAEWGEDEEAS